MSRSSLKPTIATGLIAVAAVLLWLFWIGDPCLSTAIANHWTAKNPPSVTHSPSAGSADFVAVENPYGIIFCDYWPTPADQVRNFSVFAIVVFSIGWLAARRITKRPLLAAGTIITLAMLIALSLQYWARWESVAAMHSAEGLSLLRLEMLASLALFLFAAGVAMLGAWLAIRFARRA